MLGVEMVVCAGGGDGCVLGVGVWQEHNSLL